MALAGAASYWLLEPDSYPDHLRPGAGTGSLLNLLAPTAGAAALLLWGTTAALLAGWVLAHRPVGTVPGAVVASYAAGSLLLLTDLKLLVTLGYAAAILGPPLLLLYLTVAAVRAPRLWWLPVGLLVAGLGGPVLAGVDAADVADFGRALGGGLRDSAAGILLNAGVFAGGLLWAVVALRVSGVRWWGEAPVVSGYRRPRRDWGWWVTIVAALGPVPYGLVRLTWLTPWPAFAAGGDVHADPGARVFGISLGIAALGGAVLTLGLLARWGTTYPRWLPAVGGRVVSPGWPTATAIGVGLAVTVAGRAMVQLILADPDLPVSAVEVLLVMPFPLWGPALVAAAVAYHRRRHGAASVSA